MSKRTSGLGRGLGDLLADNSPEIRGGATVVRRNEDGEATITPDISDGVEGISIAEAYDAETENSIKEEQTSDIDGAMTPDLSSEPRIIIGGSSNLSSNDPYAASSVSGVDSSDARPAHRSLKALFKSYK